MIQWTSGSICHLDDLCVIIRRIRDNVIDYGNGFLRLFHIGLGVGVFTIEYCRSLWHLCMVTQK